MLPKKKPKSEVLTYPFDNLSVEVSSTISTSDVTGTTVHKVLHKKEACILKLLSRKHLDTDNKVKHAFEEKAILGELDHPQVPKLIQTCKDQHHIGMLMTLKRGIQLNKLIVMNGAVSLDVVQLIVYQLVNILDYLHTKGILYRDLKLSNVLISSQGIISLIDFGLSKRIGKTRTHSVCGTAHTLPKELYSPEGYSYPLDFFTLGVLTYELLCAKFPFPGLDTLEHIRSYDYSVLDISPIQDADARSFVTKLLQCDESERLGTRHGISELLQHPFLCELAQDDQTLEVKAARIRKEHAFLFEDIEMGELTDIVDTDLTEENKDQSKPTPDPFAGFF